METRPSESQTRIKQSENQRRRWADPADRARRVELLRAGAIRRWQDPAERERARQWRTGKKFTPEQRANLVESHKRRWAAQLEVLLASCTKEGDCLLCPDGRRKIPYRRVYEATHGPKPPGMHIHHACGNHRCLNIKHLMTVTPQVNNAEMIERHAYKRRIAELEAEVTRLRAELEAH